MSQVIYVDVLISVNLIVNYFILLSTAGLLNFTIKRRRIFFASVLAAICSLYIFAPNINFVLSFFIKIVMSLLIVIVAFGAKDKRRILKSLACFYSSNFGFCGIIFCFWYIMSSDKFIVKNGVAYIDISPSLLLILTVVSYIIFRAINFIVGSKKPQNTFCEIKLENGNNSSKIRAKIDTGNTLREPFSNIPVIVAEYKYIKNIVPKDFIKFFNGSNLMLADNSYFNRNIRMVPFNVISTKGVLPAFKPEKITIYDDKSIIKKEAYVAVCNSGNLGSEFEALLNPELLEK